MKSTTRSKSANKINMTGKIWHILFHFFFHLLHYLISFLSTILRSIKTYFNFIYINTERSECSIMQYNLEKHNLAFFMYLYYI